MATDELKPLVEFGPFIGLDTADADPLVPPGYARTAINVNTYRSRGALMPERGRVPLNDVGTYLAQILVISPITTSPPHVELTIQQDYDQILIQGLTTGNALKTLIYDITSGSIQVVSNALKFTQAVQYGQVVYTNGGQRFFAAAQDINYPKMYTWQYTGFIPSVELTTSTTGGFIPQELRLYVFTQQTVMPDGTVSETSPENFPNPRAIQTGAGTTNSVTLTSGAVPATGSYTITGVPTSGQSNTYVINGTNYVCPQVTGYSTTQQATSDAAYINQLNGTLNPTVFASGVTNEVIITSANPGPPGNVITTTGSSSGGDTLTANQAHLTGGANGPENWTGLNNDGTTYTTNIYAQSSLQAGYFLVGNASENVPFLDTLSDAQLAAQTPLLVVNGSAFQRDPPPVGQFGVGGGRTIQNFGFLRVHKNCMFVFAHVDSVEVAGTTPQCQLWYSQAGKPWEFSADTNVLLLQDSIESTFNDAGIIESPDYNSPRGDYAKALGSAGSYLVAAKKRELWLIYGDGTDQAPFTQQRILDFGAQSVRALTSAVGGCFVKTENGLYFFDGNGPQYDEIRFRTVNTSAIQKTITDDIHSVGVFSNLCYVLFYPTLNKGFVYNTVIGDWITELPYAPTNEDSIFFETSDPASGSMTLINKVVAARSGLPTAIDYLFADDVNDLGSPQILTWQSPENDTPGEEFKKEYKKISVYAPVQNGQITITVTVDQNPTTAISKSFDLSAQRPLFANLELQGYSANVLITVQGIGSVVPVVWKVKLWGPSPPARKLELNQ